MPKEEMSAIWRRVERIPTLDLLRIHFPTSQELEGGLPSNPARIELEDWWFDYPLPDPDAWSTGLSRYGGYLRAERRTGNEGTRFVYGARVQSTEYRA